MEFVTGCFGALAVSCTLVQRLEQPEWPCVGDGDIGVAGKGVNLAACLCEIL